MDSVRGSLTLDVNGDACLLAVRDRLVGGLADDLLSGLDVGGRQVEGAHCALPPPVSKQSLEPHTHTQGMNYWGVTKATHMSANITTL